LLRRGDAPADVAQALGFADQSHFHRTFRQRVAMTPRAFQRAR
jgi:AraC-like DNA-binding protein